MPPISDSSANIRAAGFMLAAQVAFVANDSMVKVMAQSLSIPQIMAVRGCFATMLLLLFAWYRGALRSPRLFFQRNVVLRTVGDTGTTFTYIGALALLPIANVSAIYQALPLVLTLAVALLYGEPVGWRRWSAIAVGFAGILIIVRPGPESFSLGSLLVLAAVLSSTLRDLAMRGVPPMVPSVLVCVATSAAVTIAGAVTVPLAGWSSMSAAEIGMMVPSGLLLAIGYIFFVEATRAGDVGFVAPFRYAVLVFSIVSGIVVFGDFPSSIMLLGAGIVVASGLYTLYRERMLRVRAAAAAAGPTA
ncbi:DMT family transporter [Mangrovicella endophytica]|uniref:DMT family transporter n=1 Tax=Mangrovicella endophytica TaxID=2066697 RepID=UPI000C9E7E7F|nr:DMT family transporter [Mangrovicella endophytica]